MKSRLTDRVRHSNPQLEPLPIEKLGRSRRGFSMEMLSQIDEETIKYFRNDQIIEAIERMEKEKKNLYLENILYSRYLRRVESSKIIETYEEYEDKHETILSKQRVITHQTTIHAKLPEIARRLSVKRSSINRSKATPLWSKLRTNWREYIYTPYLLRVEKEKFSMSIYEIEQTKLDWERMKINARLTLDHLDDLLRASDSEEISQENLLLDLKKSIKKFKEENLLHSRLIVPAELVINRINKRIYSRINLISLLLINTVQMQFHLRTINSTIHSLDDLRDQMDEIDINFVRTRHIDYLDIYETLDRKYKSEKLSQYPLFNRLQKWKKLLSEHEQEKLDYEYKYQFLSNHSLKLNDEINSIKNENHLIFNENIFLKNRIINIKNVPTITNYAQIIEQTKKLQHEIYIWSKRVDIAQVKFCIAKKICFYRFYLFY